MAIESHLQPLIGHDGTMRNSPLPQRPGQQMPASDDLDTRVRDALRSEPATSRYAESLFIGHRDGEIVVRGAVDQEGDSGKVAEVVATVPGVAAVVNETEVDSLDE